MPEFMSSVGFFGNEIIEAVLPLAPTTGAFVGQICRNAAFYPVIWNGTTWVAPPTPTVSYSWRTFRGSNFNDGYTDVTASSSRYMIAMSRGVGIRMQTSSFTAGVTCTTHVDTGVVACRPMNVAYVSVAYNDTNVPANNGSTLIGHYTDIETAMLKYANMGSTGEKYLIYVNAGNHGVINPVNIPSHICLHLAPKATISGYGSFYLTTGSQIMGDGDINVPVHVIGTGSVIEANSLSHVGVAGWANIKCTKLDSLYVSVSEYDAYYVNVDCIEIGNVRTGFMNIDEVNYQPYPNPVEKTINGISYYTYCHCVTDGVGWECPYGSKCMVGQAIIGQISTELMDYYSKNCMLTIRANKRIDNSQIFVSVGNVKMSYHSYMQNGSATSTDTYISGLASAWNRASTLQITGANESTMGLGYQVCGGAILRLNNVRHYSLQTGMPANIEQITDGNLHSYVSLRDTMLCSITSSADTNVKGVEINSFNLMDLASFNSYGNNSTPVINCNQVLGTALGYTPIQQDIWA